MQRVLILYNLGNRSGALLEANAGAVGFEEGKESRDEACNKEQGFIWLSAVGSTFPWERVTGQYGGIVEAGKILSKDLQFLLPTDATPKLPQNAVVCLDMVFSRSASVQSGCWARI